MTARANPSVSATRDAQAEIPRRSRKAAQQAARPEWTATVWRLRRKGLTFQAIEDETAVGGDRIPRATACRLYAEELKRYAAETKSDLEAHKALHLARLEGALARLDSLLDGDARAFSAFAKLTDQIAKLLGLYAPLKVEHDDKRFKRLSDSEMEDALRQGAKDLGYRLVPAG